MSESPQEAFGRLFAAAEAQAVFDAVRFTMISADLSGEPFTLDMSTVEGVDWTPEKREIAGAYLAELFARRPDNDQRGEGA